MRRKYVLGLACCLTLTGVAPAQQTTPAQPTQTNNYPPALHRMNDVNNHLKLNQEQVNRLNDVTKKIQEQYGTEYGNLNKLNDNERTARLQELNRQYYHDWNKSAAEILNDQQRTRYTQLHHQFSGFNSLSDPAIQKRMNLSAEQLKTLRDNVEWDNRQMHNIQAAGATNPTKAGQLYDAYWRERQQRFGKFLNSSQQQEWRAMTGDPYAFQPNFNERR